jgi:hypothetical protein
MLSNGSACMQKRNERLWAAGLRDEALCRQLTNPGFSEVFSADESTLDNPTFRVFGFSLMAGKLDWLMYRGALTVSDAAMGNHDYSASDHKWLAADFVLPLQPAAAAAGVVPVAVPRLPPLSPPCAGTLMIGGGAVTASGTPRAKAHETLPALKVVEEEEEELPAVRATRKVAGRQGKAQAEQIEAFVGGSGTRRPCGSLL